MITSRNPCVKKAYKKKIAYDRTVIVYQLLACISLYVFPNHKAPVESSCLGSRRLQVIFFFGSRKSKEK